MSCLRICSLGLLYAFFPHGSVSHASSMTAGKCLGKGMSAVLDRRAYPHLPCSNSYIWVYLQVIIFLNGALQ